MHRILFAGVMSVSLAMFSGCPAASDRPSNPSTVSPAQALPGIFRLNLSAEVSSLDPAFADNQANTWAVNQLYNGLLRMGDDMKLAPGLANSWESDEGGRVFTFTLREASFHNDACFTEGRGRRVTAQDVVYSFQRLLDPEVAADGGWVFRDIVNPEGGFEALNDTVIRITLNEPFMPFLSRLTMPYCSIVAREAVEAYGPEFRNHPVGTGPFQMIAWEEGEQLTLTRNGKYWKKDEAGKALPYLEGVRISFIADKGSEFLQFEKGGLDFVSDLDPSQMDRVLTDAGALREQYKGKMQLLRGEFLNTEYLGIYAQGANNPLNNPKVRQAINCGFDREKMMLYLRNGKGFPAGRGMVPPSLLGEQKRRYGYKYDQDEARRLLADAGYPDGEGMSEIILRTNDQYLDLCTFIQAELGNLGIPMRIETMDGKVLRELMVKGDASFFRASWIADYPDAESYLTLFYGENSAPPNYTRYRNPSFDALYKEVVAEPDADRRLQLYREMDSLVIADAPVIPLYYDEVYRFVRPGITGLEPNPMNMLWLEEVRKP